MSAEGVADPQPQRRKTAMIPSIMVWRVEDPRHDFFDSGMETTTTMPQSKESSRFFSVEAGDAPNLLSEKSCERERFTMCAAAKCSRQGGVIGLYAQRGSPPCSRMTPKLCVHTSRGSQQKYIAYTVAPSERSCCGSSVCDEYIRYTYWPNGSGFI